ncbi:MAG: carboxypeptidase-like regulatory domain-containing protein [Cyclobacteriaceae bacterium]|tara:strand:- start:505 stop:1122 length:618 start_codon:yes stop_codon:yes gene_type:complete
MLKKILLYSALIVFSLGLAAQDQEKKVIQFTGVIFGADSVSIIPGVHVYVPKVGRGTTTNPYGFFSMPVLEGDSIVFSAVGFQRESFVVPKHEKDQSLKVIVTMKEDIAFLEEVEVFPYPSEAMFKEAVLAVQLPNQEEINNIEAWLAKQYMREAYKNLPASPGANHRYFMDQQAQSIQNRYMRPQNNLLNPFAWAQFINSLKGN